jgi:RNA methyltransferase, TrmH family
VLDPRTASDLIITSSKHPAMVQALALITKPNKGSQAHILVEAPHPIEEALKASWHPLCLFVAEPFVSSGKLNTLLQKYPALSQQPCYTTSAKLLGKLTTTDSPPPVAGLFRSPISHKPAENLAKGGVLVLDAIGDPGNLGTLLRSAVAFGITQVILTGQGVNPYNPKVIRATAGLLFRLQVQHSTDDVLTVLDGLYQTGHYSLYLTSGARKAKPLTVQNYHQVTYAPQSVIVLGAEGPGLSPAVFNAVSQWPLLPTQTITGITIPMAPGVDSLNVGVSGAIIMAQWAMQSQLAE